MSHNTPKVGTATPDRLSSIPAELSDLSDVGSAVPAAGEMLQWGGASWGPASLGSTGSEVIFIGSGSSQSYYASATDPAAGVDVYLYDAAPINTITGATITSTSNWVSSVTLAAGTYMFEAALGLTFSTTATGTFNFHDGSALFGIESYFGSTDFQTGIVNRSVQTFAGSTTVTLQIVVGTSLNTTAAQGTRQAERAFLSILKSA